MNPFVFIAAGLALLGLMPVGACAAYIVTRGVHSRTKLRKNRSKLLTRVLTGAALRSLLPAGLTLATVWSGCALIDAVSTDPPAPNYVWVSGPHTGQKGNTDADFMFAIGLAIIIGGTAFAFFWWRASLSKFYCYVDEDYDL